MHGQNKHRVLPDMEHTETRAHSNLNMDRFLCAVRSTWGSEPRVQVK